MPSIRRATRPSRFSCCWISSAIACVWRGFRPDAMTKWSVYETTSRMSRITMSVASFSAARAAIRLASWVVLLRRSSPLATRTSLARTLAVQALGGDELRDRLRHAVAQLLAAANGLPDRRRGQVDRLHLERDDVRSGRLDPRTRCDDQSRQLAHPLGHVPTGK